MCIFCSESVNMRIAYADRIKQYERNYVPLNLLHLTVFFFFLIVLLY